MQHFLYDGDSFWSEQVSFDEVELGDVIVFSEDAQEVVHAVIGKYDAKLVTAGYNNKGSEHVKPEQVLERVCEK